MSVAHGKRGWRLFKDPVEIVMTVAADTYTFEVPVNERWLLYWGVMYNSKE